MEDDNKNRSKQEQNRKATAEMAANDERQAKQQQANQNERTKSNDTKDDPESLTNHDNSKDSISLKEKNVEKLKNEQDTDFGIE